jgi:hypothetical protein
MRTRFRHLVACSSLLAAVAGAQSTAERAKAKADSIAWVESARIRATGADTTPVQQAGSSPQQRPVEATTQRASLTLEREVFSYPGNGRRDPMLSLTSSAELRPLLSELKLIAIIYDEEGSNHLAVLQNIADKSGKTQYRVKVGQALGRMRVAQITRREIVFTLNEFGFSRQERLSIKPDTTKARTP